MNFYDYCILQDQNLKEEQEFLSKINVKNLNFIKPFKHNISDKKIAIVGSGFFDKPYGSEIDAYTTVARFNNFKIKGFEDSVGSKTTINIINSHCILNPLKKNTEYSYLLIDTSRPYLMYDYYRNNLKEEYNMCILKPSMYFKLGKTLNRKYKTQGYFFVELCKNYFEELHLYGFHGDAHYFNPNHKVCRQHPLEKEHEMYKNWASSNFIIH
jgi:hypothetical protein